MANAPFSRSLTLLFSLLMLLGCTRKDVIKAGNNVIDSEYSEENGEMYNHLTTDNSIRDIVNHPAFEGFGELLLPRNNNFGYYDTQLRNIGSLMPYHSHVDPDIVVGAINHMIDEINDGKTIFNNFYVEQDHTARRR